MLILSLARSTSCRYEERTSRAPISTITLPKFLSFKLEIAPEPQDQEVKAHLLGGIPKAEVEAKRPLLEAHGFNPTRILVERN